jgi:hypothetical protein
MVGIVVNTVVEIVGIVVNTVVGTVGIVVNMVGIVVNTVVEIVGIVVNTVVEIVGIVVNTVVGIVGIVVNMVGIVVNTVVEIVGIVVNTVVEIVGIVVNIVVGIVGIVVNMVGGIICARTASGGTLQIRTGTNARRAKNNLVLFLSSALKKRDLFIFGISYSPNTGYDFPIQTDEMLRDEETCPANINLNLQRCQELNSSLSRSTFSPF